MAEALKTLGNEAFKNNDFARAIEHFTEAIGIDGTNHVLYSNRSAARVRYVEIFFLLFSFFEAFFDRLHLSLLCVSLLLLLVFKEEPRRRSTARCRAFYFLSRACVCVPVRVISSCRCFALCVLPALKKLREERERRGGCSSSLFLLLLSF